MAKATLEVPPPRTRRASFGLVGWSLLAASVAAAAWFATSARVVPERQIGSLAAQERLGLSQRVEPEARKLHSKGREMWNKRRGPDLQKAIAYFQAAIERDPAWAPPYSGLADAYALLSSVSMGQILPHEAMPKARAAAERALLLDPDLAEAYASRGLVKAAYDWDPLAANRDYEQALALNPGCAAAQQWYSESLSVLRRHDAALAAARRARDLDPLSLVMSHNVGRQLYYARRIDEAIVETRKTVARDPQFGPARVMLGLEYAVSGRPQEAVLEFESADSPLAGYGYGLAGRRADALRARTALRDQDAQTRASPIALMYIQLGLGDTDGVLAALEQALQERSDFMPYLAIDPALDPVREDPRFRQLLELVRPVGPAPE